MKKIIVSLMFCIILINLASAFSLTSTEDFIQDATTSEYGKYQIYEKDMFLFKGDLIKEIDLNQNTETCGGGVICYSYFNTTLFKEGTLVDKWNIYNKETMNPDTMRWMKLEYYTGSTPYEVNDYETQCTPNGFSANGTAIQSCEQVVIGTHTEYTSEWQEFSEGQIFEEGDYQWRASGDKAPWKEIEWTFETSNIETVEWATWGFGNMNVTGLVSYWKLDDINMIDSLGLYNGTNTESTSVAGKINNGTNFDGSNDQVVMQNSQGFTAPAITVNAWVNVDTFGADKGIVGKLYDDSARRSFGLATLSSGGNRFRFVSYRNGTDTGAGADTSETYSTGQWYMITGIANSTGNFLYVNGSLKASTAVTAAMQWSSDESSYGKDIEFGRFFTGNYYDGKLDEVSIWNRSLNSTEIGYLYNAGVGLAYPFGDGQITLNSPLDASITPQANTVFNSTATLSGGATLTNMSLWTNSSGSWAVSNTTILNNIFFLGSSLDTSVWTYNRNAPYVTVGGGKLTLTDTSSGSAPDGQVSTYSIGSGNYDITAYLNVTASAGGAGESVGSLGVVESQSDTTSLGAWIVRTSGGNILYGFNNSYSDSGVALNIGSLYKYRISKSGTTVSFYINDNLVGTKTDSDTPTNRYITMYAGRNSATSPTTDYFNITGFIGPTNSTQTWNLTIPSGSTLWNVQACDSDGACGFATANYTVSLDAVVPSVVLNYPTALINYGALNGTLQLNFTATDSNLASCWYNYNGTNVTTACTTATPVLANITLSSKKNVTIYANDTAGNLNATTFGWDYYVFETAQIYSTPVAEGTTSTFTANLTMTPTYRLSSATLHYNGETNAGTATEVSTNNWQVTASRIAPSVTSDTNYTFYWTLTFENSQEINSTSYLQQVNNIAIDNCSTYSNELFNFTMLDEDAQTVVPMSGNNTGYIKIDMQFKNPTSGAVIINYSAKYSNQSNARVCSGASIGNSTFALDGQIEYFSTGRFIEFYNLKNYSLNTTTTNQNITLYDLNSTSTGLEFKINYKNTNFRNVPGALIQIKRKYVDEGVFKVVELPMVGADGYAIAHLIPANVIYSLVVVDQGTILDSFDNIVSYCPNPTFTECTLNINSYGSAITPGNMDTQGDFSSTLTYNKTSRVITAVFAIPSGATSTVSLNATKADAVGTTVVCNDTLTASGGTLTCTIPPSIGNTTIKVYLTADGVVKKWFVMSLQDTPQTQFGANLIFLAIVMLLFFVGIGVQQDPKIMGIVLVFGVIVMAAINLITSASWIGKGATILWFVAAVILIVIKSGNDR